MKRSGHKTDEKEVNMAARGTIPETMKALVAYGRGDYRFEPAYPTPECGPDDIIIKTEGCGICAGDGNGVGIIAHSGYCQISI